MEDHKRSAMVDVYADGSKENLIHEVPVINGGNREGGIPRKATDEELIASARNRLRMANDPLADSYFYQIRK